MRDRHERHTGETDWRDRKERQTGETDVRDRWERQTGETDGEKGICPLFRKLMFHSSAHFPNLFLPMFRRYKNCGTADIRSSAEQKKLFRMDP